MRDLQQGLKYAEELIALSQQSGNDKYLRAGYFIKGTKKRLLGNLDEALDAFFKSAELAKKLHSSRGEEDAYSAIGDIYSVSENHPTAMLYYNKAITLLRQSSDSISLASALFNAGDEFRKTKSFDSALLYFQEAKLIFDKANNLSGKGYSLGGIGMVYANTGQNDLAIKDLTDAIRILEGLQDYYPVCDYLNSLADAYLNKGDHHIAVTYAIKSLHLAEQYGLKEQIRDANLKLSELYEKSGDIGQSLKYYKNYISYRDSVNNIKSVQKMADLRTDFEVSRKQTEVNVLNQQKKLQRLLLFITLIVLSVIIVLVIFLLKNNRQKQKAYMLLSKAKAITEEQRDQTNKAMEKLTRAQAHLIQSEKMASLGELTAGIAHEIQNPLNFVNNFSEVNIELISELQAENKNGNQDAVQAIAEEIFKNEEKITHHGKRADAIVKGMLQHSRSGVAEKRLTNINALADEYFRLAYHGLRAKDKSFNAEMHTDFDPAAGDINIVPQEIGRVILNLVNNAFYAVVAKNKEAGNGFRPAVSVSTKKINDQLLISVKDNGTGMSAPVKEKIFQPFFTTKDPGLGTGLGLSLSYDIVKAHGGEIKIESEEGMGSEFVVVLPTDKG
ncbi:MAG: ATP-binding protein [Bacteroidota bacterium]|nr:ATP-binding protein [Bacteroidota bacterium]